MKSEGQIIYLFANGISSTPSTRLRWFNYLDIFRKKGIDIQVITSGPFLYRLKKFKEMDRGSVVLVQKKLLSIFELIYLRIKMKTLIFDIDDSIWLSHPSGGKKFIKSLKQFYKSRISLQGMRFYDRIICANAVLEEALQKINPRISVVPTSPSDSELENVEKVDTTFRVVWTGTKSNFFYLDEIGSQLKDFLNSQNETELCIISDGTYTLDGLNNQSSIRNVKWTVDSESEWIQKSSLGIMPLTMDEWSRGKSGFKLIKYMKLGIPVLATDFGFQKEMIHNKEDGFLIENTHWAETLSALYDDSHALDSAAIKGRQSFEENYAPSLIVENYLSILDL